MCWAVEKLWRKDINVSGQRTVCGHYLILLTDLHAEDKTERLVSWRNIDLLICQMQRIISNVWYNEVHCSPIGTNSFTKDLKYIYQCIGTHIFHRWPLTSKVYFLYGFVLIVECVCALDVEIFVYCWTHKI